MQVLTAKETYRLYKKFTDQYATYTSEHPEGTNVLPVNEIGTTRYEFYGSVCLAEFVNFVLKHHEST